MHNEACMGRNIYVSLYHKPLMPLECKGYFGIMVNPQKDKTLR